MSFFEINKIDCGFVPHRESMRWPISRFGAILHALLPLIAGDPIALHQIGSLEWTIQRIGRDQSASLTFIGNSDFRPILTNWAHHQPFKLSTANPKLICFPLSLRPNWDPLKTPNPITSLIPLPELIHRNRSQSSLHESNTYPSSTYPRTSPNSLTNPIARNP